MTGKVVSSAFLWGDAEKKEHRQWTGLEGGMKRGKGKKGARGEKEKSQEEERGRRTKLSWTSERVRKIMQDTSIAIAISRRFCRENQFEDESGKWDPDENWDEDNAAGDNPWDLQAGHGTHIAGMIYARELMEGNNTIISRWEKFRQGNAARGTKRKRTSFEDEMDEVQAQQWKKLRTVDIQQALEEMFGAGTQFRGLQKLALEAIMKHESPILVVMGTRVGKSMLFQIPAKSVSSGTTIVITPLVSLQSHIVERCQQVGISCKKWDSQHMGEMRAQIVIVTPESAVSKTFGTFLNELQGRQELVCIVFNKCHTVMDSTPDFQPQMQQLGALSTREVQMVFLTATLPKHTEPEFMRIMKIKPEELVGEKLEQYAAPAKIIVYGGSIKQTQELSKALGCHQYYCEVGDQEEKGAIIERWQRGDGRLIVATNAFGLGIDAPDVQVVIYASDIYQMWSYSQESGRGGRDGEWSEAIVVVPAGRQEELQKKIARAKAQTQPWKIQSCVMRLWEVKQVEWEKMERFLSGSKCRRIYLDSEMDDRQDQERCEVGEEQCDVCEKDDAMFEDRETQQAAYVEEQRVIQEQAAQAERERQGPWVDSGINVPSSSIYIPAPSSLDVDVQHTLENCPDESRTKVIAEIKALKTIRFEPYASCTFCTVAQKVCTWWAETREGSNRFRQVEGGVCQYDGIVRAAVAAMSIAAPVEVAREGLFGQMKAKGI
ncbi:hypothetical protein VF21_01965 [Pseudogymnoascus sp. 05NY08]|nr:hypothetical protein VF21_01965 [Pseudogymnoascus sp. 05NY08]